MSQEDTKQAELIAALKDIAAAIRENTNALKSRGTTEEFREAKA